jgi:ankyrin repeat protein
MQTMLSLTRSGTAESSTGAGDATKLQEPATQASSVTIRTDARASLIHAEAPASAAVVTSAPVHATPWDATVQKKLAQLFDCIERADLLGVRRLAAQDAFDVHARRHEDWRTPLMAAIVGGHEEIASELMRKASPAQLAQTDSDGNSALDLALDIGMEVLARMLLNQLRDMKDHRGYPPLVAAIADGREIRIFNLLKITTNVNGKCADGTTALAMAIRRGKTQLAIRLLEKGAFIEETDAALDSPLGIAAQYGDTELIEELIQRKARVDRQNSGGVSALAAAARGNRTPAAARLLKHGANPNLADHAGATPMHLAATCGGAEIIALLIRHRGDVHLADSQGHTALHMASINGHVTAVEVLLKAGAKVDTADRSGKTALQYAAENHHPDCSRLLIEHGADVHHADTAGITPLEIIDEEDWADAEVGDLSIQRGEKGRCRACCSIL